MSGTSNIGSALEPFSRERRARSVGYATEVPTLGVARRSSRCRSVGRRRRGPWITVSGNAAYAGVVTAEDTAARGCQVRGRPASRRPSSLTHCEQPCASAVAAVVRRPLRWRLGTQNGVDIGTLDNPGWSVKIALGGTGLEERPFDRVHVDRTEDDWLRAWVEADKWNAACGPLNLVEGRRSVPRVGIALVALRGHSRTLAQASAGPQTSDCSSRWSVSVQPSR